MKLRRVESSRISDAPDDTGLVSRFCFVFTPHSALIAPFPRFSDSPSPPVSLSPCPRFLLAASCPLLSAFWPFPSAPRHLCPSAPALRLLPASCPRQLPAASCSLSIDFGSE